MINNGDFRETPGLPEVAKYSLDEHVLFRGKEDWIGMFSKGPKPRGMNVIEQISCKAILF